MSIVKVRLVLLCSVLLLQHGIVQAQHSDTVALPEIEISASRYDVPAARMQQQASVLTPAQVEERQAVTPKDMAALVPGLVMPDYGSAMTSSIYIRGLGSRIDNPVIGFVIDGVPLLDKNMYDQHLPDIRRMTFLRGPQGTLYGRNTMGGLLEISTLQPLDMGSLLVRARAAYSTANTVDATAAVYHPVSDKWGWALGASFGRTDGFHTNTFSGKLIDRSWQVSGRFVLDFKPDTRWRIGNTLSAGWTKQGAFPYYQAQTGVIAFDGQSDYRRFTLVEALKAEYKAGGHRLCLSASYQMLDDLMNMDQDYTPAPVFTLRQRQRVHGATADAMLSGAKPCKWYDWHIGAGGFVKHNNLAAPVTFLRQGIDSLILKNANKGITSVFPDDSLEIHNNTIPILSDFGLLNAGAAIWHQSMFSIHKWRITLGLRLDYEHVAMQYDASAELDWRFSMVMEKPEHLHTQMAGRLQSDYINLLPRVAVSYDFQKATIYAYAAKGHKAGGYNQQIFSTVMQNKMMHDLSSSLGIHLNAEDPRFLDPAVMSYKPEKAWTCELGTHLMPASGLKLDADLFFITCRDRQVTIFPNGKTTGRMMSNAAQSRAWGAEAEAACNWQAGRWQGEVHAAYSFTDARFVSYDSGMGDFSGKYMPYSTAHTMRAAANAEYRPALKWLDKISAAVEVSGMGEIWWNEQNTARQPFYALLCASVGLHWKYASLRFYGKNMTGSRYDVFWFKSMDNEFLQRGKPRELGVRASFSM